MPKQNIAHKQIEPPQLRYAVQVGARGRIVLPAEVREQLGVVEGDKLILTVDNGGAVRLAGLKEQVEKMAGCLAHLAPSRKLVDELIRERKLEAQRE